jgi:hypothetical protein
MLPRRTGARFSGLDRTSQKWIAGLDLVSASQALRPLLRRTIAHSGMIVAPTKALAKCGYIAISALVKANFADNPQLTGR